MTSILETFVANEVYISVDAMGICNHACSVEQPFKMCEVEADDLFRFDPEAYKALQKLGITREEISIQDISEVGRRAALLTKITEEYGDGKKEFLYKYAMSMRLDEPLLISKIDPYHSLHVECQKKFKNKIKEYP